jgi:hypothetical protein
MGIHKNRIPYFKRCGNTDFSPFDGYIKPPRVLGVSAWSIN